MNKRDPPPFPHGDPPLHPPPRPGARPDRPGPRPAALLGRLLLASSTRLSLLPQPAGDRLPRQLETRPRRRLGRLDHGWPRRWLRRGLGGGGGRAPRVVGEGWLFGAGGTGAGSDRRGGRLAGGGRREGVWVDDGVVGGSMRSVGVEEVEGGLVDLQSALDLLLLHDGAQHRVASRVAGLIGRDRER